jgi:hypothetical protein
MSLQEVEIVEWWLQASMDKCEQDPISKTRWAWWFISVVPATQEAEVGGFQSESSWGKSVRP